MKVLHILQHCNLQLYKPLQTLQRCCSIAGPFTNPFGSAKLFLQGMVLSSGLQPTGRWLVRLEEYHIFLLETCRLSCTTLPVPVSHLILVHQSVPLRSCADGGEDATLSITAHGGSTPLLFAVGSPDTSEHCYQVSQDCLMALKMGFPSGLAG